MTHRSAIWRTVLFLASLAGSAHAQALGTNELAAAVDAVGTRSVTYEVVPGQPYEATLWMLSGPLLAVLEGWGTSNSSHDLGFRFNLDVQWTGSEPGTVESIEWNPLPEMQPFTFMANTTFTDNSFHFYGRTSDDESIYCIRGEQPLFSVTLRGTVQPGVIQLCPVVKDESGYRAAFQACSLFPPFPGYFRAPEQPCATLHLEPPSLPLTPTTWSALKSTFD